MLAGQIKQEVPKDIVAIRIDEDGQENDLISYPWPYRGRTNALDKTFSCLGETTGANTWTLFCENSSLLLKKLRSMGKLLCTSGRQPGYQVSHYLRNEQLS